MRLDGRRESTNVDDRRGRSDGSGKMMAGGGGLCQEDMRQLLAGEGARIQHARIFHSRNQSAAFKVA